MTKVWSEALFTQFIINVLVTQSLAYVSEMNFGLNYLVNKMDFPPFLVTEK